jgi:signal transduction histidine kinase
LLERVAFAFSERATTKGVLLTVASSAVGEMVSDRRSIEQIMMKLIGNAVKFTDRGRVTLTAERVADLHPAHCAAPQSMVRITVADTGVGIKAKDMPSLFRAPDANDTCPRLCGDDARVGLTLSRCLARLLGGEISADSEWSKGSRFSVFLPLCLPSTPVMRGAA